MSTLVFKAEDATTVTGQTEFSGVIGTVVTAPTVEKTGYTFVGWKNESGEIVAAPTEIPAEDLTLTAEWVKNVTVAFDTDGGSTIDPAPYTDKTPGTELVAPADPTKEGYTFLGGWMQAVMWSRSPTYSPPPMLPTPQVGTQRQDELHR